MPKIPAALLQLAAFGLQEGGAGSELYLALPVSSAAGDAQADGGPRVDATA